MFFHDEMYHQTSYPWQKHPVDFIHTLIFYSITASIHALCEWDKQANAWPTVTSQNEKTTLLGKTKQDYASILRWMSFANTEVLGSMGGWFRPLMGKDPYNKKNVEDAQKKSNNALKVMEDHLMINTYLVGERLSLADIICAGIVGRGFELVLDKAWRKEHPSVTRWYETVANQPNYKAVQGEPKLVDEAIKYTPPKKEEKPKQEAKKAEPSKKAAKKEEDEEEEEEKPVPKPKHPLEELPKASMPIDEWKRKFKNEETREVALPWFWENMPLGEEYSIWQLDYKYNDELSLVFMTSNLISEWSHLSGPLGNLMTNSSIRRSLRTFRRLPQVHPRLYVRIRREQRQHDSRRIHHPRHRPRQGLRCRTRLGEL